MLSITTARKRRLCEQLLRATGAEIGFADVRHERVAEVPVGPEEDVKTARRLEDAV